MKIEPRVLLNICCFKVLKNGATLNCPGTPHHHNDCIMLRHIRNCRHYYYYYY